MNQNKPIKFLTELFISYRKRWESPSSMRLIASFLIASFLILLLLIGIKKVDIFNEYLTLIPDNPFKAIEMAFTLLLFFEVISLVFSLEKSISKSMTIQLEILSLILLRNAFKIFGEFHNSISLIEIDEALIFMFSDAFAALIIFVGIGIIKKIEQPLSDQLDISTLHRFINKKRLISLIMLFVFVAMILLDVTFFFMQRDTFEFFKEFYTILIFTDILIVFISMRYSNSYVVLFRNSGYALATVIIRIALSAAAPYNAIFGLIAMIFVMGIVLAYNKLRLE